MNRSPNDGAARVARAALIVVAGLMLAGCDLMKPSPSASHAATPSATPSAPTPSAISSAELVGHHYVLAVVEAFRRDPFVAHVVEDATATASQGSQTVKSTVTMTMDLSGRDLRSVYVIKQSGKTTRADLIVVGKTAYARTTGSGWKKAPRNGFEKDVTDIIKAMRLIDDPADLRYVGLETVGQRELHHLTAAKTIPYLASNGATGKYDTFDIWIAEDGTPVLVKSTYSARLGTLTVKGTANYSFSHFGGPLKIAPPKTT